MKLNKTLTKHQKGKFNAAENQINKLYKLRWNNILQCSHDGNDEQKPKF